MAIKRVDLGIMAEFIQIISMGIIFIAILAYGIICFYAAFQISKKISPVLTIVCLIPLFLFLIPQLFLLLVLYDGAHDVLVKWGMPFLQGYKSDPMAVGIAFWILLPLNAATASFLMPLAYFLHHRRTGLTTKQLAKKTGMVFLKTITPAVLLAAFV